MGINYSRSVTFNEFFKGRNIRGLEKIKGLSRTEFWEECNKVIARVIAESIAIAEDENGGTLSPQQLKAARFEGWKTAWRSLGRTYLFFFVVKVLRNEKWLDNDYTYRLCEDVQANKWKFHVMLWVIAREHFKSTIITAFSTLWEIINNPDLTFAIISYNDDAASGFLSIIKTVCENNELLRMLYDDVIWPEPAKGYMYLEDGTKKTWSWTNSELEFKRTIMCKEKTIQASGVGGGAITGMHFSRLIMDDIETSDMVKTSNYIATLRDSVVNLFNAGQSEDLRVTMVGTFYARNDMYCDLILKGIINQSIIQPCIDLETGHAIKLTDEQLAERLKNCTPTDAATQWFCDPSLSENATFNYDKIKRWSPSNLRGLNIYTFVDPAGTVTNKSDYTCILTVGYDSLGNIMIIDIIRDKLLLDQKFFNLASIVRKYQPKNIFYEKVGMQADIEYMQSKMSEYNIRFPITQFIPKKGIAKEVRIESIIPEMDNIYFPFNCFHKNWQGVDEDMCDTLIRDEMMAFPKCDHDDALDTIAMAVSAKTGGLINIPKNTELDNSLQNNITQITRYNPLEYAKNKQKKLA